jgi:RNA polymerase sigma-70 factor (ECF subfamily)
MEQHGLIINASRSAALASLVRILGDIDLAEEAVQEASLRAVIDWKKHPAPDDPIAWLVQTGRRYAIDHLRHRKMAADKLQQFEVLADLSGGDESAFMEEDWRSSLLHLHDDQLRLIFTCCHPVLSLEAQVALTLKTVASLETAEIARSFLLPVATLQRRLNRAKQKIRREGIPYAVPGDADVAERLEAVLRVIYLIYNQAYTVLRGGELFNHSLSEAAIYLARVLNRLLPDEAEALGLLALLLLQHARAPARVDATGLPVSLEQQDRSRWNSALIAEAGVLLEKCDRHWRPGPYQVQAAIAAVHCNAPVAADTDWQEIVDLYDLLESWMPGPVVTLNRAVAIAGLHGPAAGLELLDNLASDNQMADFQYFHSARAGLLERLGDSVAACKAFDQAIHLCQNDAERRYMQNRIQQLAF